MIVGQIRVIAASNNFCGPNEISAVITKTSDSAKVNRWLMRDKYSAAAPSAKELPRNGAIANGGTSNGG